MAISTLSILALIVAYMLSIASAGNTVIYSILRKRTDGENLFESEEIAPTFPDQGQEETNSLETKREDLKPKATQTPEGKITMETTQDNEKGKIDD